jgi:glycosyltransferase involved in cell wall biosynthesis
MRIVHIEAGRHLYGGAAQVRHLVDGLAAARVDNVLVCPPGSALAAAPPAGQLVELPMGGELDLRLVPRLTRVLRDVAPDIVHVHSRRGADLYGGMAAALAGVPAVLTRRVDAREPAWLGRLKYRPYRVVIALSRAIEAQLRAAGVDDSRIARIPSAVDSQRFRPDVAARARLLTAFALPADALVIGVVAQLIERKRHAWLVGLLPELVRRQPNIRVLCFGAARSKLHCARRSPRVVWRASVLLVGYRSDLPEIVPGLDVLAHPAAREGLGVALLEAASAGVPVVACAAGGVPDVVEDGRTGMLVAVGDAAGFARALESLLAAPAQRRQLGVAARARVERHFGVAGLVDAHRSLYDRLLAEPSAAVTPTVLR